MENGQERVEVKEESYLKFLMVSGVCDQLKCSCTIIPVESVSISSRLHTTGNILTIKGAAYSFLLFLSCTLSPLSPHVHSQALLSLLSQFPSSFHALNKLYSILYHCMAGTSGGKDASAWAPRGTPFPIPYWAFTKHIPGLFFLSFFHWCWDSQI